MKKITIITLLAGATTFGLFAFMAFLVSNDHLSFIVPPDDIPIDIVRLPDEKPAQTRVRPNLQPPTPPPPMPRTSVPPEVGDTKPTLVYNPPGLIISGNNGNTFSLGNKADADARPLVRVNPKYPIGAARDGIEGWVVLAFDINAIGEVINISIVDSQPKRTFDKAARQALKKWKYRAKSVDGKAVVQQNFTVQLDFSMAQPS
ncbi:energy transducer TonB [Colwellia psychrerythraea]|uniref:TonB family protein n=1 Tax=Colwellia psychrerythraea TaxID=28229 RepID=A0A099L3A8_COLPS|nr:energy transducer TonB [Colwellia psychrerythraea]KGJ97346.1 TonB family protein [Colwellia psychrerythraea]